MRMIRRSIEPDGSGFVTLFPEEPEDMWHAYNLIRPKDLLRASAIRRVTTESATGSTASTRVHATLVIRVRSLDFDPQASQLHVSGQIAEENKVAKIGQFHTLDLELHRNFTLEKAEGWDSVAIDMLKEAVEPEKGAQTIAVVMHEGLAHICFITSYQTVLKAKIEVPLPRKRISRALTLDKARENFFMQTLDALLKHIDLLQPVPVLLASPGYTALSFLNYIKDEAVASKNKDLTAYVPNFVVTHSSSGHVHALQQVLQSPEVLARLKNTKYARETKLMDEYFSLLRKDDGRACYGPKEVENAVDKGAVGRGGGVLLISNRLFRSQDIETRKRWVSLVDRVKKEEGGEVRVMISEHESGMRLEGLGGIAAILTFPIEDEEEDENEQDNEIEKENYSEQF